MVRHTDDLIRDGEPCAGEGESAADKTASDVGAVHVWDEEVADGVGGGEVVGSVGAWSAGEGVATGDGGRGHPGDVAAGVDEEGEGAVIDEDLDVVEDLGVGFGDGDFLAPVERGAVFEGEDEVGNGG